MEPVKLPERYSSGAKGKREALSSWKDGLASQRAADGSPRYSSFSPVTDQIDSCRKVMELVNGLSRF